MVLNIIFLAGGIGIGYLLRGEINSRKSKKAFAAALDEGIKIAEKWLKEFSKKEDEDEEDFEIDEPGEISFEALEDLFKDSSSNSTDETIKL